MTAQILKITTPFNSRLYWTGSTLSDNVADAVMVTDNNRVAWYDKCDADAMIRAQEFYSEQFSDSIVEMVSI